MTDQENQLLHDSKTAARQTRVELFQQTFERVIWLDVVALSGMIAALQDDSILVHIRSSASAPCLLTIAATGFGLSLIGTLIVPIWRAWWSVSQGNVVATATYVVQGIAAGLSGVSVLIAACGFLFALLY